jgi:hydroxyacylglutathione hydrolase
MGEIMPAEIHVFRCLEDNIGVLVRDAATGACASIDVPEARAVLRALEERNWRLTDILVTHRHGDHIQGIPEVKSKTGCRVVGPAKAAGQIRTLDETVQEGDRVAVGDLTLEVWETPGHCADHVSYWCPSESVLFCGDTLFTMGCGRVLEGSPADLWKSLERIASLPADTTIYCGHDYTLSNARFARAADPNNPEVARRLEEAEEARRTGRLLVPTTLAAEQATNPFLRAREPALARAVGLEGAEPVEVFRALREWKNRF